MARAMASLMPATAWRSATPALLTALAEPKCFSSAFFRVGPIAGHFIKRIQRHGLLAPRPMGADGEAMGFVAQALDEVEHGIALGEAERLSVRA